MRGILLALFLCAASAASAQAPSQAEWAKTLAAAKKEGVLTISGPPGPSQRDAVVKMWQTAFPDLKIDYTGARGTQILSKVVRERQSGLYNWDVVLASTDPTVFMLPPIHALAPLDDALIDPSVHDDSKWIGGFDAGFVDDARKYFYAADGSASMTLGYVNRDCVSRDVLSNSGDLMNPALKGKIAWYDPFQPGIGSRSTWRLSIDKGDDWLKRLLTTQQITFSRDYRQMAEWVVSCQKPVVIGIPFDTLYEMQAQGIGKSVEQMSGPAYFGNHGVGWAGNNNDIGWYNNAPHPNAAKLFVNLYLSQKGQQTFASMNPVNSRRIDVKGSDPDPGSVFDPKIHYDHDFGDEDSIRQVLALEAKIKSWGVAQ